MARFATLVYGVFSYLLFLAVFAYAMGFIGNAFVPKSIDSGPAPLMGVALLINLALVAVFGLQHSVMARPTFKKWITRFIPQSIERATYVFVSNLCMIALFILWQPMPDVIWDIHNPIARTALWTAFVIGWLMVPLVSILINHLDLFGVRQAWLRFRGRPYTHLKFRTPGVYNHIRHPLYVGWMIAFWATPTMSAGHLLFAVGTTVYILIAIQFEERNLMEFHSEYAEYRTRTGWFLPRLKSSAKAVSPEVSAS